MVTCALHGAAAAVWLAPPCCWRWPPQPASADGCPHSLETLFLPPADAAIGGGGDGALHWLRPGMLAFATVSQAGELQVIRNLLARHHRYINWVAVGCRGALCRRMVVPPLSAQSLRSDPGICASGGMAESGGRWGCPALASQQAAFTAHRSRCRADSVGDSR